MNLLNNSNEILEKQTGLAVGCRLGSSLLPSSLDGKIWSIPMGKISS